MKNVIAILCLLGCALAAEEKTDRKSRQILTPVATPVVPIVHHPHVIHPDPYLHQQQVVASAVQYLQADPRLGLIHHAAVIPQVPVTPAAIAIHHPGIQRAYGPVQPLYQTVNGPYASQSFRNLQNQRYLNSLQQSLNIGQQNLQIQQHGNQQINDYRRFQAQGPSQNSQNGVIVSSTQAPNSYELSQALTASTRNLGVNQQSQSLFSQQSQEQNLVGFSTPSPLDSTNNQQSSSTSYFRQSPQQQQNQEQLDQQQVQQQFQQAQQQFQQAQQQSENQQLNAQNRNLFIAQFNDRTRQQNNNGQFQGQDEQIQQNGQQTLAIYPTNQFNAAGRSFNGNLQAQSRNEQLAAILSQTGQFGLDGSYSYGFQSENGIQSSQVGMIRNYGPHISPLVHGSYSYTAPDGTPISAQYYADHTGFHVRGAHIPSPPPSPGYGQESQQPQPVEVESN